MSEQREVFQLQQKCPLCFQWLLFEQATQRYTNQDFIKFVCHKDCVALDMKRSDKKDKPSRDS